MNVKGVADTLQIDPLGKYKITAHTLPSVTKDSITITPGKHNIIGLDTPQGDLKFTMDGSNEYKKLQAIVRQKGELQTLNIQDFGEAQRYLIGEYDVEVLTLPRIYINNVNIAQSKTTTVQIPNPGIVTIISNAPGYGSILIEEKNKLNWVTSISENTVKESVVLQPGNYRIVFRPKNSQSSIYTIEKSFVVTSGNSNSIILN
jgi:Ca-activated chloride channel family protein